MKSYGDFRPINLFLQVLTNSPQSAFLYLLIWQYKNKAAQLTVNRNEVEKKFFISPTIFKNRLLSIEKMEIISFEETLESFQINFFEEDES